MTKLTQLAAATVLLCVGKTAVAQDYSYSTFTAPFQYLANPDTLSLTTPDWDDDVFFLSLGFPVNALGETYDSVAVESNGTLILYNDFEVLQTGTDTVPLFMPFGEFLTNNGYVDLRYRTTGNSPISYEVTGTPGARIAKIEWRNAGFFNDPGDYEDSVNFQAWIYEGSGDVEFRYGTGQVSLESYDGASGPTVGIGPLAPATFELLDGYYLTGNASAPTLDDAYTMLTGTPADGTVFRFANNTTAALHENATVKADVFPNPAAATVNVRFKAEGNTEVAVTDLAGHTLLTEHVNANGTVNLVLDIAALSPGMYMLAINGAPTGVKLMVKQ